MAMIKCPECGKEVSDKANSCPNCGMPIAMTSTNTNSNSKMIIWKIVSIFFFAICLIRFCLKSYSGFALALDYKVEKGYLFLFLCMCSFTLMSLIVCFLLFSKHNTMLMLFGGFHILLFAIYIIRILMSFPEEILLILMASIENGGLAALFIWECVKRKRNPKGKDNIPYFYAALYFVCSILNWLVLSVLTGFAGVSLTQKVLIWPFNYFNNFNISAGIMSVIIVVSSIPIIKENND